jgi:hypothetical protein
LKLSYNVSAPNQEGTHDQLVTAYAKIWTGLVKLEDWLRRELVAIIGSGEIDPSQ